MVEIRNRDELRAWLDVQSPEIAAVIAARSALRVIPFTSGVIRRRDDEKSRSIVLTVLRATLNSAVTGGWPKAQLRAAANAANAAAGAAHAAADAAAGAAAFAAADVAADAAADIAAYAAADVAAYAADAAAKAAANAAANTAAIAAVNAAADAANAVWVSVSFDASTLASGRALEDVRRLPLWAEQIPQRIAAQWVGLRETQSQTPAFAFWLRWYDDVLVGGAKNWAILRKIVLIDDEVWEAGPEAVAEKITEIEARYTPEPIPKSILREQVTVLIQNATITQVSGNSLALQIEDAITSYLREEERNGLPEDLSVLEHLPAVLRRLTRAVSAAKTDDKQIPELELSIQAMAAEIEALKRQLDDLMSAKPDSIILDAFKQETGKMASRALWGAVITGSYMLLGEQTIASTLNNMAETLNSLWSKPPN